MTATSRAARAAAISALPLALWAEPALAAPPGPEGPAVAGLGTVLVVVLGVGVALWMLSRVFRRGPDPTWQIPPPDPSAAPYGGGYGPGMGPNAGPGPGYGPGYGYGPPVSGGGSALGNAASGALGGLGGAILGNVIYDHLGRPVEGPAHAAGADPSAWPQGPPPSYGASPLPGPGDPPAGVSGDWSDAPQQADAAGGSWDDPGQGDAVGGDWPDPGAGGNDDWSGGDEDAQGDW